MQPILKKAPFLIALWLAMPALVFADEIFLKDAGSFSGRITAQTDTTVTIDTGDGSVGVPVNRIDRIVKGIRRSTNTTIGRRSWRSTT
jgi:hypothetical protein